MTRKARLALATATALVLSADGASASAAVAWQCPEGFEVKEGLNVDFPHKGAKRAFWVYPASADASVPQPVWVPLTGSVESTNANLTVARSGANALMAQKGFMVIGPVRACAGQDPALGGGVCNGPGRDGWNWNPWNEGRAANASGDRWKADEGPDSTFFEAMVRCVGTKWKLDPRRLFLGGISSGGTMTNRAMVFNSDFWSGGLSISGEWYVTRDDGSPLTFAEGRTTVAAAPTKIHQGRIGPIPLPRRLDPLVVITVWGGERDTWDCGPPLGLCADYRPSTQAGSNYFAAQANVVHVACSTTHGHSWPQVRTQEFNDWALRTLASHPKGTPRSAFRLTPPPDGYKCQVGRFTDHYPAN